MLAHRYYPKLFVIAICIFAPFFLKAQSTGEVMFVGFNADNPDGIAFVTFVPLPNGTTIYFNDSEWNGSAIGGGGAFSNDEGAVTWTNNTGNTISAGTVISIQSADNAPTVNLGSVTESNADFDIGTENEVVYMFLGSSDNTPTVFLSAIANKNFATVGSIGNTGLTIGASAIEFTLDQDVMVYTGSTNCNSTVAECAVAIATPSNWGTQDTAGNDATTGGTPDFPATVDCDFFGTAMYPATIYYSHASGDWDDNTTWSLTADGSGGAVASGVWPRRSDHVFIQAGHTVTVNAVDDNKSCGLSPDNVGAGMFLFSNIDMFYQVGDIVIDGALSVSTEMMIKNYTHVSATGSYTINTSFVNLGYLEADASSTVSSQDAIILAGASTTIINTVSVATDELIISHTSATLCGTGSTELQNGGGSQIRLQNSASLAQICTSYTVTCLGVGCTGFPVTGTGTFPFGNTAPGGVGNQSSNQLWLRADDLELNDAEEVTNWSDVSGNGLTASQPVQANRPIFRANDVNGILPSIEFDGQANPNGDFMNLGTPASLNFIPGTDSWSFFIVYNVPTLEEGTLFSKATNASRQYQYTIDDNAGSSRFTSFIGGNGNQTIGSQTSTDDWFVSAHTNTAIRKDSWTNENPNFTNQPVGTDQLQTTEVLIGARRDSGPTTATGFELDGKIAEIVVYNAAVNTAQRIIIVNYLAAKYDIALLAANDIFNMDDNVNGDFDFEVAGIGQASDNTRQIDSRGTGIVRMWAPNDLTAGSDDFLLWGHDNGLMRRSTDVDGTVIEERLERVWRIAETAEVGTVNISFDISSFDGDALGPNLRLLIDRNGNGFGDNDVTPVAVSSFNNNIAVFSGINFQDGDQFTLGNTDLANPLPVELLGFRAIAEKHVVRLNWVTASETNNHFFTVERSKNAKEWQEVKNIPGAGTSKVKNYYETVDDGPYSGVSYYRLKQTDFDTEFKYFNVVRVVVDQEKPLVIYPNPFNDSFKISADFEGEVNSNNIKFLTSSGVEIPVRIVKDNDHVTIDPGSIPGGLYILKITDGLTIKTVKVIKRGR